ncbi:hypothetical protein P170DRAFT_464077 [Aspergillus steynii IBT 23096]|uniref:Uncharacterized protein n=1 Tax=Aspergillus steynii IBT 23096 TaxID=1392250 RepID=A0A2I2GDU8_9EURO|nr:uncharacterized protein P170DRAFT_464077 [Aspergillus steynii IBT 23096]PLB51074.1 hypothetical protein P170DRAFT_464077 [Aspergillus steynii IBT 23096]
MSSRHELDSIMESKAVKAAQNELNGFEAMSLLLGDYGDKLEITGEVVKAAVRNERSGPKVLALLLEERGDKVRITEEVVKAAVRNQWSGESLLALLLDKRGGEVKITEGQNDHIWIRKLQGTGYSLQEIANLLLDEVQDSLWIFFEPTEIACFVIQPNRHVPRCSHRYCSEQQYLLEDPRGWLSKQEPAAGDFKDVLEIVEELCGLAGIGPTARTESDWVGFVELHEDNQSAVVSYILATDEIPMFSVDRLWSRISQALEKLCCAAGLIQARDLCCNSFTFLRLRNENLEAPAKPLGEVVRVGFQLQK